MDCPSEERIIRMALGEFPIMRIDCNIPNRKLIIYHNEEPTLIDQKLIPLNLGSSLVSTEEVHWNIPIDTATTNWTEKKVLIAVLLINLALFITELLTGIISNSLGLIGDSFDMLADVAVYGLSIIAIGGLTSKKIKVARISGYFQAILAVLGFVEVVRRFLWLSEVPNFQVMIVISTLALVGNLISLYLLRSYKNGEVHMQASWIFTSNDVLVNIGVIVAGILVYATGSKLPDLMIGAAAFILVAQAARRILKL